MRFQNASISAATPNGRDAADTALNGDPYRQVPNPIRTAVDDFGLVAVKSGGIYKSDHNNRKDITGPFSGRCRPQALAAMAPSSAVMFHPAYLYEPIRVGGIWPDTEGARPDHGT
jgi:hypothetical protein